MNMHSKLFNNPSVHPPLSGGGGLKLQQNFQKRGKLDRTSIFRGALLGKRGDFIKGSEVAIFT